MSNLNASVPAAAMLSPKLAKPSITIVGSLFAALVGIGLTGLIEENGSALRKQYELWPFVITLLVSLRFLTGSANHLWREHIDEPIGKSPTPTKEELRLWAWHLTRDLGALTFYGCVIAIMCYVQSPRGFWLFGTVLMVGAIAWGVGDKSLDGKWWFWIPLDLLHLLAFSLVWQTFQSPFWGPPWSPWLFIASVSSVILVVDFLLQFRVLTNDPPQKPTFLELGAATIRVGALVLVVASAAYVGVLVSRWLETLLGGAGQTESIGDSTVWRIPVRVGLSVASLVLILAVLTARDTLKRVASYISEGQPLGTRWWGLLSAIVLLLVFVSVLLWWPSQLVRPQVVYLTKASEPLEVFPVLFDPATADGTRGTTLSPQQKADVLKLLETLKACLQGPKRGNVVITVRGFADDNTFLKPQWTAQQQEEGNLDIAYKRRDKLLEFVMEHTKESRNPKDASAPRLSVEPHPWSGGYEDMKSARPYSTLRVKDTGPASDQGYLNRRADIVLQDAGACETWRNAG